MTAPRQPPDDYDDYTDLVRASGPDRVKEFQQLWERLNTLVEVIEPYAIAVGNNNRRLMVLKTRLALARQRGDQDLDRLANEMAGLIREQEELLRTVGPLGGGQAIGLKTTIEELRKCGQLPDQQVVHDALVRLDILDENAPLPHFYRTRTGKAGRSRVHYLHVTNKDGTETALVAKFDDPERAEREWAAVDELRRVPHISHTSILPINGNVPADGVILYRIAANPVELEGYLLENFLGNMDNCEDALARSLEALCPFHETGTHDDKDPNRTRELVWKDFYGWLPDRRAATLDTVRRHCPAVDWQKSKTFSSPDLPDVELPNPFYEAPPAPSKPPAPRYERMLAEATGKVRLSRIHGDLNLTNILLSRTEDGKPGETAIIDVAYSADRRLTASDFAFLETHFWLDVFSGLAREEGWGAAAAGSCLVSIRDELEGRPAKVTDGPIPRRCARLIGLIRERAAERLRAGGGYLLKDYFRCLFFANVNALGYQTVLDDPLRGRVVETMAEDPLKAQIILLNAALALRVLDDQRQGKYVGRLKRGKLPKLKKPR